MRKIEKYDKELRDEDTISPYQMFECFVPTIKFIRTQNSIHIQNTQHNICPIKNSDHSQLIQQDIVTPKSTAQFNIIKDLIKSEERQGERSRSTASKRNFHKVQNSSQQKYAEMMKKRKKWQDLKDVLTNQKINILKDIFIQKIKRNNPFSTPVQFDIQDGYKKKSFLDQEGIQLSQHLDHILSVILIIQIAFSLFFYTLALVFDEVSDNMALFIAQFFSICVSILQITISFIHKKTVSGRKIKTLREIMKFYARKELLTDSVNLLALILSMATRLPIFGYFRIIMVTKFPQILQRVQKLQIYVIDNYYNQQYWSLAKTFILNFCFAHILAILLVAMTNLNENMNWMVAKGVRDSPWIERYVWSYYWGTNIMLTVGFGDVVASTYQEAICLILIETFSCLALAYNINCVGSLISNIRAQDIEKSKNFKVFKKLIVKNNLPQELSWRINNYIEESINIKKKFSLEEEKNFIEKLPNGFKKEVLKESNKNIFDKLTFFHSLMEKTLYSLAEKIEMCIYHPQEIIQPLQDNFNLFILKAGEIGYVSKKNESSHFNKVIDVRRVGQQDNPFLINLHFITKKRLNFEVKSLVYSVLYYLQHDKLIDILYESPMDYQLYSYLKDKNKNVLDQFQVFPCQYCKTKHTKFNCPKIHFIPITQHVVNKYLRAHKIDRNKRRKQYTIRHHYENVFCTYQYLKDFYPNDASRLVEAHVTKRKQKTKRIIDSLRSKILNTVSPIQCALKRQQKFIDHTTEIIRQQFVKLLGKQLYEDDVWSLSLDKMKNYRGYFILDNPSNLKEKFNCQQRQSKLFERYKIPEQIFLQKFLGGFNSCEMSSKILQQFKNNSVVSQQLQMY